MSWRPTTVLTASGERVEAPDGFETYVPEGPPRKDTSPPHIKTSQVVLLTNQNEIAQRITVEELGAFMKAAEAVVFARVPAKSPGAGSDLMVQCDLSSDKPPKVTVASRPALENAVASAIQKGVEKVPPPKMEEGTVSLTI